MGLILDYTDGESPLSEEEREDLKIKSISSREDLNEFEQQNIEMALEWAMKQKISLSRLLTEKFIKDLHYRMFNLVWAWAGKFRKSNKNIGVDWTQVAVEVKKLLDNCLFWVENKTFSNDEIAIRLKHGLVLIHPFPNGNGRHSRLIADVIIEKIFKSDIFSWGGESINSNEETRLSYLKAVREADKGNFKPLLAFAKSIK